MSVLYFFFFFFFQAEDGIRDLVRSRGLGDVYKETVIALHLSNYSHIVNMLRSSQHYLTHRHLHFLHLILSLSEFLPLCTSPIHLHVIVFS